MGIEAKGEILFPKERKRVPVEYDDEAKKELQDILFELQKLVENPVPPPPKWIGMCSKCGFSEFCWAGEE